MGTWWRTVIGILAGGAQAYAGGLDWKHVLAGLGLAALGIVSHLSSTSDATAISGPQKSIHN